MDTKGTATDIIKQNKKKINFDTIELAVDLWIWDISSEECYASVIVVGKVYSIQIL